MDLSPLCTVGGGGGDFGHISFSRAGGQTACVCVRVADMITCVTMSSCPVASLSNQMSEKKDGKIGGNES